MRSLFHSGNNIRADRAPFWGGSGFHARAGGNRQYQRHGGERKTPVVSGAKGRLMNFLLPVVRTFGAYYDLLHL
jgi:hypothetical protein